MISKIIVKMSKNITFLKNKFSLHLAFKTERNWPNNHNIFKNPHHFKIYVRFTCHKKLKDLIKGC